MIKHVQYMFNLLKATQKPKLAICQFQRHSSEPRGGNNIAVVAATAQLGQLRRMVGSTTQVWRKQQMSGNQEPISSDHVFHMVTGNLQN